MFTARKRIAMRQSFLLFTLAKLAVMLAKPDKIW